MMEKFDALPPGPCGRNLPPWSPRRVLAVAGAALVSASCAAAGNQLPAPRPLVNANGVRLYADTARMEETHRWVTIADETVRQDPTFWVIYETAPEEAYPWETMELLSEDSVRIAWEQSAVDARLTYEVYAFLHLMVRMGRMEAWFPEAVGLEGYALERFIVDRTADSWLLGRAVFDLLPYRPLDEIIYAQDRGFLDAFLLTARGADFPDEKAEFERDHPGRLEEYHAWFQETFKREPPGLRSG